MRFLRMLVYQCPDEAIYHLTMFIQENAQSGKHGTEAGNITALKLRSLQTSFLKVGAQCFLEVSGRVYEFIYQRFSLFYSRLKVRSFRQILREKRCVYSEMKLLVARSKSFKIHLLRITTTEFPRRQNLLKLPPQ